MSTQTVQATGTAALPRVNLMPPEIAEAARFRQIQLVMGAAVLGAAAIVGALYVHERSGVSSAQANLATAQAQQVSLQSKLNSLASVRQTFADVQAKQQLLTQAMGQEIRWSYVLNDLSLRIPGGVWLTAIQATETSAGGAATTGPTSTTLATSDAIGNILINGVALKHDGVAQWLDSLAKEKGFEQPNFTSSNQVAIGARDVDAFASAASLTSGALSNRYTHEAGS